MVKLSIEAIKRKVKENDVITQEFLDILASDPRAGVQSIYRQLVKMQTGLDLERKRTETLYCYEKELIGRGIDQIAGVDEVGRGPLAGPVVAAAVILPQDEKILNLNDSKKLTAKKREELAETIKSKAIAFGYGIVEADEIDRINIYQATLKAMELAIRNLNKAPEHLLIDAVKLPQVTIGQTSIIGGDGKSASIAAASILAKVYRDNLMLELDRLFPQYSFKRNKGYGTKEHLSALKEYGPCLYHRKSFSPC